ncbi:GNAT family N-acetyltransferase [Candidatus Bathyarchaeota archaeon]|nr:MAG: GNAT family N-acetyltransferase [Candidatus Bathyarchaeota archaeon]
MGVSNLDVVVRRFSLGDESVILEILSNAFGSLQDAQQPRSIMASRFFDSNACFIAEEDGSPVGCVALTGLPRERWYVVRFLAVKPSRSKVQVAEKLLGKILEHLGSRRPEFVRATTPAVQPYVDVYKQSGFRPVRRDFRITWDLKDSYAVPNIQIVMRPVLEETAKEAASIFVRSLASHWDWRTAEQGGTKAVEESFVEGVRKGEQWMVGQSDGHDVGIVGIIPDFYRHGEARFRGAYVLPENRDRGIGMELMSEISRLAIEKGQGKMTVFTFSYLDCLTPGALLYLRSGGKIDAEYLQLERVRKKIPSVN